MIDSEMDVDLAIEESIKRKLLELETLVNLLQNEQVKMSDDLRIRYFERIDLIIKQLNKLKIQRSFSEVD